MNEQSVLCVKMFLMFYHFFVGNQKIEISILGETPSMLLPFIVKFCAIFVIVFSKRRK